jgi:hypothetical protein
MFAFSTELDHFSTSSINIHIAIYKLFIDFEFFTLDSNANYEVATACDSFPTP